MERSLGGYDDFKAENFFQDMGNLVGAGECGGKAKGIAYAMRAIQDTPLGSAVGFPDLSIVLSTEVFDDFIEENRLSELYDDDDWARVKRTVMEAPLANSFRKELLSILGKFDAIDSPPFAVRSSSKMEDSFSLAFAGKYKTCFCPNRGNEAERYYALERSVKRVFSSLFNPSARAYREKHGRPHRDESIAVIIQSLTGRRRGDYFYPELAGTLFSRVFRLPNPRIKKEDGLMRLCFGLGTRSVDRCAARVFYLTNPSLRPEGNQPSQIAMASQENFDYIDLERGELLTGSLSLFSKFLRKEHKNYGAYVQNYGDDCLYSTMAEPEGLVRPIFSFPELHTKERGLFKTSKDLLAHMEAVSGIPVDIEFTYETKRSDGFKLLQMRPLSPFGERGRVTLPDVPAEAVIFRGDRMVSNGQLENVRHLVYVDAGAYRSRWDPSAAARAIGEINSRLSGMRYILAGPGRWGSRNPTLGVPVRYDQICNCGCLVEISVPELNFSPELSFGTHFFLDMDADGILYLPVFHRQKDNRLNLEALEQAGHEIGEHPSVHVYDGSFSVYMDGEIETGIIVQNKR
ncbi:MAG: PEP/pyruvate-binding domain-containing protein [Synergistaceae bacterium]|nr:PEP/pyruvate-binding domain-containing protein [Synergistaceae bacterium]